MHCCVLFCHQNCGIHVIPVSQHISIGSYILESDLCCREGYLSLIAQDSHPLEDTPNHCNIHHQQEHSLMLNEIIKITEIENMFQWTCIFKVYTYFIHIGYSYQSVLFDNINI